MEQRRMVNGENLVVKGGLCLVHNIRARLYAKAGKGSLLTQDCRTLGSESERTSQLQVYQVITLIFKINGIFGIYFSLSLSFF